MEKIKNLLSGHKSEDAVAHETGSSSAGAHPSTSETHTSPAVQTDRSPIYDQITGQTGDQFSSAAHPTTTGSSTSAGQTGTSSGLGPTEHSGLTGSHEAGHSVRPQAPEGISEASIKSGVIGFGPGQRQGHAARPAEDPIEEDLEHNQILGGGSIGQGSTTADASTQPGLSSQSAPHSSDTTYDRPDKAYDNTSTQQPFDKNLRQKSYTADTDRTFPLAGGVTSTHSTEHSSTHHPATSEREPGTKEKEAAVNEGRGREALSGAAAAGIAAPLLHSEHLDTQPRGQETGASTYGGQGYSTSTKAPLTDSTKSTYGHNPVGLAAATAAATAATSQPSSASRSTPGHGIGSLENAAVDPPPISNTGVSSTPSYGTGALSSDRPSSNRSESWRHVPGQFPSPTPDDSKTFLFYRDALVPVPGAETPLAPGHHAMHDQYPLTGSTPGSSQTTSGPHSSGLANKADPRVDSDRDGSKTTAASSGLSGDTAGSTNTSSTTPHNSNLLNKLDPRIDSDRDGSKTLGGASSGRHEPGQTAGASTVAPTTQHELRHTGSLEQPKPRSSDDDHHHGREAAVAGGVGVGAAGLGYAASRDRETGNVGGDDSHPGSSPYSSKGIDPRVLGSKSNLDEQKYDPNTATYQGTSSGVPSDSTTSELLTGPVHKSSLLNKLDPRVKKESAASEPVAATHHKADRHLGRDAGIVGAGGAAGAGVHHELSRNDTPGTGSSVLPSEQSSAPLSSSTGPSSHTHSDAKPAYSDNSAYQGPLTTDGQPFYGAVGAPAPVLDHTTSHSHQPASASSHEQDPQHHHGRDAGLAGAGLATAGGLGYASHRDQTPESGPTSSSVGQTDSSRQTRHGAGPTSEDPASKTIGPHKSNIANVLDPRVQPDPSKQKDHTTTGPYQSDTLNRADPRVDEKAGQNDHHYGRDAAVIGGVGAAGYGAHEAANAYGDHRLTQPGASMADQRYDPTVQGDHASNPVQPAQYDHNNDHTNRNAALGTGAVLGAGALGGAAYGSSQHADNTPHIPTSTNQPFTTPASQAPTTQTYPERGTIGQKSYDAPATAYPTQGLASQYAPSAVSGTTQDPREQDHSSRNTAIGAGAAAVAAGGAGYAYSQHQDAERLEREQHKLDKEHEKEQHKLDKEHAKQEKEAHKLEKEQHKHEKVVAAHDKQQHRHDIEQEKEQRHLEKEREKEAHRLEKERLEREKSAEATPEKKHGILGFLHRDKSKKEGRHSAESSPRQSTDARTSYDNPRHSKEYAALGASTTAAAYDSNDPNSPRWKGKNLLHKDPPPGHPAREALEHQHEMGELQSGKHEHIGTDGPIGNPNALSGNEQARAGVYGAQPLNENPSSKVIEPHTGLPMNVARYGDGHGGTDANPTVHGVGENVRSGHTTDWDAVKKNDTPY